MESGKAPCTLEMMTKCRKKFLTGCPLIAGNPTPDTPAN